MSEDQNDHARILEQWSVNNHGGLENLTWSPPEPLFLKGFAFSKPVVVSYITLCNIIIAMRDDDPLTVIPSKRMPHPLSTTPVTDVLFAERHVFLPGHEVRVHLAQPVPELIATLRYELPELP